jgi:hypothetical protein
MLLELSPVCWSFDKSASSERWRRGGREGDMRHFSRIRDKIGGTGGNYMSLTTIQRQTGLNMNIMITTHHRWKF